MATTLKLVTGELVDITAKYPSNYWHTPTYSEMYYILNSRTNASNLRTLGRILLSGGTYVNGVFLLPDDWITPTGVTLTITTANFTANTFSLVDFGKIEENGGVFLPLYGYRNGVSYSAATTWGFFTRLCNVNSSKVGFCFSYNSGLQFNTPSNVFGLSVRLCINYSGVHCFSVSATETIKFASGNLQYHCLQKKWRFAEHQYDIIGVDNVNISDAYDGWIDLFGYGTSGVNYSPTLHTTNNADYAQGDLLGTVNDWGYNEICVDSNPLDTRTKIYENKIRALEFSNI